VMPFASKHSSISIQRFLPMLEAFLNSAIVKT